MRNKIFGTVLLVGLIVFGWQMASIIGDLKSWQVIDEPAYVSQFIKAGVFALVAMAGAGGMDIVGLIKPFVPGNLFVSQQKINEINNDKTVGV